MKKDTTIFTILFIVICISVVYIVGLTTITHQVSGTNVTSVETKVNVSNTPPNVTEVNVLPQPSITLTANSNVTIICNATIFDYNGFDDLNSSNATFYDGSVSNSDDADDNNYHYHNSSCDNCASINATYYWCACNIPIAYYANNGSTWECNFTVVDDAAFTSSNYSSGRTIDGLIALDTPTELDFGNISVGSTSNEKVLNITNVGNIDLNISVRGFANESGPDGQNLSMNCDVGFIEDYYERYSIVSGNDWAQMKNITNISAMLNLTIPQKTEDNIVSDGQNATFWKLQIPSGLAGACNGSLELIATDANY